MDYSFSYKTELPIAGDWEGSISSDFFISAFNSSERVKSVYQKAIAQQKFWLIFPEYQYDDAELPDGDVYRCNGDSEGEQITSFFDTIQSLNDYTTWVERDQIKLKYSALGKYFKRKTNYYKKEEAVKNFNNIFSDFDLTRNPPGN